MIETTFYRNRDKHPLSLFKLKLDFLSAWGFRYLLTIQGNKVLWRIKICRRAKILQDLRVIHEGGWSKMSMLWPSDEK